MRFHRGFAGEKCEMCIEDGGGLFMGFGLGF